MLDIKKIKSVLESKTCKVHKEKPKIYFRNNKLEIEGCCDNFCKIVAKANEIEFNKELNNLAKELSKTIKLRIIL